MTSSLAFVGPSPWYLDDETVPFLGLKWHQTLGEPCELQRDNDVIARIGFGVRVFPLPPKHLLFVYRDEKAEELTIELFDAKNARPLSVQQLAQRAPESFVATETSTKTYVPIPESSGAVAFDVPHAMQSIGERLIVIEVGDWDKAVRHAIVALDFNQGVARFIDQDWYNTGDYYHAYQWPTAVARHPVTRKIHGIGIRMEPFVCDENGVIERCCERIDHAPALTRP